MRDYLSGHGVAMDASEFISVTSNIYHAHEAQNYDERHFSIAYSKKYWKKVTDYLDHYFNQDQPFVLDFGCGTGFATEQLLGSALNPRIANIACYDLSADMVAVCRQKFGSDKRLSFFADQVGYAQMRDQGKKFDIIVCNALMHHIPEPSAVFEMIGELLRPGGIFVMGHEPNRQFYNNKVLHHLSNVFRLYKRSSRKLFGRKTATGKDIADLTHKELVAKGIVPADFPVRIIPKFVDIHVPLSNYAVQPWGEIGFDLAYINGYLDNRFELVTQISYSHIKDQEAYRSVVWKGIAGLFEKLYPQSGADAIFLFKKKN